MSKFQVTQAGCVTAVDPYDAVLACLRESGYHWLMGVDTAKENVLALRRAARQQGLNFTYETGRTGHGEKVVTLYLVTEEKL